MTNAKQRTHKQCHTHMSIQALYSHSGASCHLAEI